MIANFIQQLISGSRRHERDSKTKKLRKKLRVAEEENTALREAIRAYEAEDGYRIGVVELEVNAATGGYRLVCAFPTESEDDEVEFIERFAEQVVKLQQTHTNGRSK